MNHLVWRHLLWAALTWTASVQAGGPHRLDDSGSFAEQHQATMEWLPLRPGVASDAMEARLWVNVRIDMRAWVGRQGRVFMVLPRDESPPLEIHWTSQGHLLPGRLVSGDRTLVYAGAVNAPVLQDRLNVRVLARANWVSNRRRVSTHFEFEPD